MAAQREESTFVYLNRGYELNPQMLPIPSSFTTPLCSHTTKSERSLAQGLNKAKCLGGNTNSIFF